MSNLTIQGVLKNYSHRAIKPFNKDVDEQYLIVFPNNYGASIIRRNASFVKGRPSAPWELAVIKCLDEDWGDSSNVHVNWDLAYDAEISYRVVGFLTPKEIVEILNKIRLLPRKSNLEFEA